MIQKKSLKDAIQNPEIISVVGELIGNVSQSKDGLATRVLFKAAGSCFLVANSSSLKIERDNNINSPVLINITAFDGPSWSPNSKPLKVCLSIPYDSGSIQKIYAKNLLDGGNMKIYKDESFNLYIKCMNTYSTVFAIEIIQSNESYKKISIISSSAIPDSSELITIY